MLTSGTPLLIQKEEHNSHAMSNQHIEGTIYIYTQTDADQQMNEEIKRDNIFNTLVDPFSFSN